MNQIVISILSSHSLETRMVTVTIEQVPNMCEPNKRTRPLCHDLLW